MRSDADANAINENRSNTGANGLVREKLGRLTGSIEALFPISQAVRARARGYVYT